MITITDQAADHLHELFDQSQQLSGLRISVMGSTGFGLTPDIAKETDYITASGEIDIIVDQQLIEYCRSITIDFSEGNPDNCSSKSGRGFIISAENPIVL